jgi:hypothetical protein
LRDEQPEAVEDAGAAPVNSTSPSRYRSNKRADVIGGVEAITTSTAGWQLSPRPPHLARAGHSGSGR